jgi:hypothetical protein
MRRIVTYLFTVFIFLLVSCSDNQGINNPPLQNPGYGQKGYDQQSDRRSQMQQPAGIILTAAQQSKGANYNPALQPQQGRYFKWTAPAGWRVSESNAGVTLTSPDGRYSAMLASLMRSRGNRTPKDFLQLVFTNVPDYKNARIISIKNLPSQHMSYQVWNFIEAEVSFTDKGLPVVGLYKAGVANYYNMNDSMIVGFRAATKDYEQAKSFMPTIAKSIVLTNANEAFGNNTLVRPKNNPNTAHDSIIEAGENKNKSQDKSMQKWSNAMRGSEPTYDPTTGQRYTSQHSSWDAARGGYVNPNRPTELLSCGTPENPQPCGR